MGWPLNRIPSSSSVRVQVPTLLPIGIFLYYFRQFKMVSGFSWAMFFTGIGHCHYLARVHHYRVYPNRVETLFIPTKGYCQETSHLQCAHLPIKNLILIFEMKMYLRLIPLLLLSKAMPSLLFRFIWTPSKINEVLLISSYHLVKFTHIAIFFSF